MKKTLAQWLEFHELYKYHDVLLTNDINTIDLVKSMSIDDLKELGVSLGDRKRFEKAFLESEKIYTDFEQEVNRDFPYVIAYPFKRMLDEVDGRNRLELMTYSFLNLMKYLGLVLASEYFNSSIRSKELNELFRNNLYQPSFGNWNAFIRDAIKILSANNIQWIFPEIVESYKIGYIEG